MKAQMFRVLARSPDSVRLPQLSRLHFFKLLSPFLFSLFVAAVVIPNSALLQTPLAVYKAGDVQGVVAQSSCYGVYHLVRPGQTIYSIAAAYGTTAYRIANCNRLTSYTVYVGQSLLVPTYSPYRRR